MIVVCYRKIRFPRKKFHGIFRKNLVLNQNSHHEINIILSESNSLAYSNTKISIADNNLRFDRGSRSTAFTHNSLIFNIYKANVKELVTGHLKILINIKNKQTMVQLNDCQLLSLHAKENRILQNVMNQSKESECQLTLVDFV